MSLTGRGLRLAIDQPARRWSRLVLDAEARRLRRRGTQVIAFQPTAGDGCHAALSGQARLAAQRLGIDSLHGRGARREKVLRLRVVRGCLG
jgi:hypothetical protein